MAMSDGLDWSNARMSLPEIVGGECPSHKENSIVSSYEVTLLGCDMSDSLPKASFVALTCSHIGT